MVKISRFCLIFLLASVITIYGEPQFRKFFLKKEYTPQVNYSSILKKFLITEFGSGSGKKYCDEDGNEYTRFEYQSFLPMIYYRDLLVWKKLPDKVDDTDITPRKIEKNRQLIMLKGYEFDSPQINLYPLYESASVFSQIEKPLSMFRVKDSMEFIDLETNRVDKKKSELFTKALKEKGFCFPAKDLFGNRNRRKPFDEGYFVKDFSGKLFHLKMENGLPFIKDTGIRPESEIKFIKFEENLRKEFYGIMFTQDNGIFLITYDNYKLIKLPVDNFDYTRMSFFMICDLMKRTIRINNGAYIYTVITDNDYNLVASHKLLLERYDKNAEKYSNLVFPLSFNRSVENSGYVHFSPEYHVEGIFSGLLCAVVFVLINRFKKLKIKDSAGYLVLAGTLGPAFLIAVLIVGLGSSEN